MKIKSVLERRKTRAKKKSTSIKEEELEQLYEKGNVNGERLTV